MKGLCLCEMIMFRGVVYVCYVGGLVYVLEGWEFYEVGVIDVGCIDEMWVVVLK